MLNLVTVSAQDPMENVKTLLTDLIAKLEKEAKEKKSMEIEKLETRIEKATATKQEQEELIATNSEEIAAIEKANAEATKLRNEQNANFVKIDTDFSGAAEAVDDAIDALKEYYGDSALIQVRSKVKDASSDSQPTFGGAKLILLVASLEFLKLW